jgi:hypothetical protein
MPHLNRKHLLYGSAVAVSITFVAVIIGLTQHPEPPQFHQSRQAGDFIELLAVPPTSAYGSSINIWVYEDDQHQPQEIVVTGHADQNTCEHVSRLLFSTAIQKNVEPEDLLVAGAARLGRHENVAAKQRLEQLEVVQNYMDLERRRDRQDIMLRLAQYRLLEPSNSEKSALDQAAAELAATEAQLNAAEASPDVKAYIRETRSGIALPMLVREAARIEKDSGLVHVHHIPQSVATEVRERIHRAALNPAGGVVTFDDLLKKVPGNEAAVLVNTLQMRNARPLSITVPLDDLSAKNFEEVRKLNRGDIESAMVGDARERLHFYADQHADVERELKACANLTPEELDEKIVLNEHCTPEGICFPSDEPDVMTRREYCTGRLPLNLHIVNRWTADAEKLMQDINDDDKRENSSQAAAINHATLVDSMLRDWDLPVSRDQRAFDVWSQERRRPVWRGIAKQLRQMKIDMAVVSGENIVFAVKTSPTDMMIQPVQVIDLRRSVVVANPQAGATRIVDAWQKRELKASPAPKDRPLLAKTLLRGAFDALRSPATAKIAADRFRQAFAADPRTAAAEVMNRWRSQFPPSNARLEQIRAGVMSWAKVNDFTERFNTFSTVPAMKESPVAFLKGMRALLKANPEAPPEYHLVLAMRAAQLIDLASRSENTRQAEDRSFDVLTFYASDRVPPEGLQGVIAKWQAESDDAGDSGALTKKHVKELVEAVKGHVDPQVDPFVLGRLQIAAAIGEDPAAFIAEAVRRIRSQDNDFWQRALAERGLPSRASVVETRYEEETAHGRDPITREAITLARVNELLMSYDHALRAADSFFNGGTPHSSNDEEAREKSAQMINDAITQLDYTMHLKSIAGDEELLAIRKHLDDLKRGEKALDTLTRVELGTKIKIAAERLLLRAQYIGDPVQSLTVFPEHRTLDARVAFEDGAYDKAFAALFQPAVPVAHSAATLKWTPLRGDGPWDGAPIKTRVEGRSVSVSVVRAGREQPVLLLSGCSNAEGIASAIEGGTFDRDITLSSQILLVSVPLEPSTAQFRQFVVNEPQKSILLKAMVYGCAAPGFDLIPHSERCGAPAAEKKAVSMLADVQVPPLNAIRDIAKALMREK